jgi:hypothetical protein
MIHVPSRIDRLLSTILHEVIAKLIEAVSETFPWIYDWKQYDCVSYPLNLNFGVRKLKLFRQSNRLAVSAEKNLGSVKHCITSRRRIYVNIYFSGGGTHPDRASIQTIDASGLPLSFVELGLAPRIPKTLSTDRFELRGAAASAERSVMI